MRTHLRVAALLYGFVLFYVASVVVGGVMAARSAPTGLFASLGQEPALALLSFGLHFLPTVTILVFGTWLFARQFKAHGRDVARLVVLGAASSYVFWLLFFAIQTLPGYGTLLDHVLAQFSAPWWAWPALVAPFAGLALAFFAGTRHLPPRAEA